MFFCGTDVIFLMQYLHAQVKWETMGISGIPAILMIITCLLQGTLCNMGIPCTFYGEKICSVHVFWSEAGKCKLILKNKMGNYSRQDNIKWARTSILQRVDVLPGRPNLDNYKLQAYEAANSFANFWKLIWWYGVVTDFFAVLLYLCGNSLNLTVCYYNHAIWDRVVLSKNISTKNLPIRGQLQRVDYRQILLEI